MNNKVTNISSRFKKAKEDQKLTDEYLLELTDEQIGTFLQVLDYIGCLSASNTSSVEITGDSVSIKVLHESREQNITETFGIIAEMPYSVGYLSTQEALDQFKLNLREVSL